MDRGIAHHAAPGHGLSACLELRLDEGHHATPLGEEPPDGWQHQGQRDEGQVERGELDQLGKTLQRPEIRAVQDAHPWISPQPLDQLSATHVDRVYDPSAALEQHVREAAGAGAGIQRGHTAEIQREGIQRGRQLLAAP